jgi:hypothetical protein
MIGRLWSHLVGWWRWRQGLRTLRGLHARTRTRPAEALQEALMQEITGPELPPQPKPPEPTIMTEQGLLHRLPVWRHRETGQVRRGALLNPHTQEQKKLHAQVAAQAGQAALTPRQKVKLRKAMQRAAREEVRRAQQYPTDEQSA